MGYRIKKLKIYPADVLVTEPKIELRFEKLNEANGVVAEINLKTNCASSKKLRDALYDLNDEVIKISEINLSNDQLISVREIRFRSDEKKGLGVEFICELLLKNSHDNLVFRTPCKYDESQDEKESLPQNIRPLIDEVILECEAFIQQANSQYELPFENIRAEEDKIVVQD